MPTQLRYIGAGRFCFKGAAGWHLEALPADLRGLVGPEDLDRALCAGGEWVTVGYADEASL